MVNAVVASSRLGTDVGCGPGGCEARVSIGKLKLGLGWREEERSLEGGDERMGLVGLVPFWLDGDYVDSGDG